MYVCTHLHSYRKRINIPKTVDMTPEKDPVLDRVDIVALGSGYSDVSIEAERFPNTGIRERKHMRRVERVPESELDIDRVVLHLGDHAPAIAVADSVGEGLLPPR